LVAATSSAPNPTRLETFGDTATQWLRVVAERLWPA
jgi:hypothetical protein